MPTQLDTIFSNDTLTIQITGPFTFAVHHEFRDAYQQAPNDVRTFVVDFGATENVDSSALGMLLQLNEHAIECGSQVELRHPNERVRGALATARFDKLFTIR